MKRCPKCGCETFHVSAHVVQDWKVNRYGDFEEVVDDCIAVAHYPDNEDIWDCANCDYSDAGYKFEVEEE
jgi:hypothetical protein